MLYFTLYGKRGDPSNPLRVKFTSCPWIPPGLRHRGSPDMDSIDWVTNTEEGREYALKEKIHKNIIRARGMIYELVKCNHFDWFFTGTLAPDNGDRADLDTFRDRFTQFIRDYSKRQLDGVRILYLLVPELHADKENWHFHGFLANLPEDHLHKFVPGDQMGKGIVEKLKRGEDVYTWPAYGKRFGFNDLERIKSQEAAARYVSKYVSKSLDRSVSQSGKHLYYASLGLQRAQRFYYPDGCPEELWTLICENPNTIRFDQHNVSVLWVDEKDIDLYFEAINEALERGIEFTLCNN